MHILHLLKIAKRNNGLLLVGDQAVATPGLKYGVEKFEASPRLAHETKYILLRVSRTRA